MILLDKSINNLVNNSKDSYLEMVDRKRDKDYPKGYKNQSKVYCYL